LDALKKLEDNVLEFYRLGYGRDPKFPLTKAEDGTPLWGYDILLRRYFERAFIVQEVPIAGAYRFILWPAPGVKPSKLKEFEGEFEGLVKTMKKAPVKKRVKYAEAFVTETDRRYERQPGPKDLYEPGYTWNQEESSAARRALEQRADNYQKQAEQELKEAHAASVRKLNRPLNRAGRMVVKAWNRIWDGPDDLPRG
jgi:hypothetical protein